MRATEIERLLLAEKQVSGSLRELVSKLEKDLEVNVNVNVKTWRCTFTFTFRL